MFYLYKDLSDEFNPGYQKLVRAPYSTLEEAKAQAEHDMSYGYRVICIEESDEPLGGAHHTSLERGKVVWKPKKK